MAKVLAFKSEIKKDGRIIISSPTAGYTVVAVRDGKRMVRYATAWCSPADQFRRKTGKQVAADKFHNGETAVAPMAGLDDDTLIYFLTEAHDSMSHG